MLGMNYANTMVIKGFDKGKLNGDALLVFRRVKKLLKGHANARDRYLDKTEFGRLVDHCPRHLKNILVTGYWSGIRKSEIPGLTWNMVNMTLNDSPCVHRHHRRQGKVNTNG
jgi:hypothetical protein